MRAIPGQAWPVVGTAAPPALLVLAGLPGSLVAVGIVILVALVTLVVLVRSPGAVTLTAVAVVAAAVLRQAEDPGSARVVATSLCLALFLYASLRWVDGVRLPDRAAVALLAVSAVLAIAVLSVSSSTPAHGVVPLALGLVVTLAAYRIAVPVRVRRPSPDGDEAGTR
jgi:hypothetical protein